MSQIFRMGTVWPVEEKAMTEHEWMVSEDPQRMLHWVTCAGPSGSGTVDLERWRKRPSERKLRLFACSCVRQVWDSLTDERSRKAVEVAERFADSLTTPEDLRTARSSAFGAGPAFGSYEFWAIHCCDQDIHSVFTTFFRHTKHATTQAHLLRDIVGNPHRPVELFWQDGKLWSRWRENRGGGRLVTVAAPVAWLTPAVLAVARTIYEERCFEDMPIMADALEEAGCDNEEMLKHCRNYHLRVYTSQSGIVLKREWLRESMIPHVRGCWLLDLILGYV